MRIKPRTVAVAAVIGVVALVLSGAVDKFFVRVTGTVVRREGGRR